MSQSGGLELKTASDIGVAAAALLAAMKIIAYAIEMGWFLLAGSGALLASYKENPYRTYAMDRALGRPRIFSRKSVEDDAPRFWKLWGIVFKTPILVPLVYICVGLGASHAHSILLFAFGFEALILGVFVLTVPVVLRLTLGPYDVLNPDLKLPPGLANRLYEGRRNSLGLYVLLLLALTLLCFASAYDALGAVPGVLLAHQDRSASLVQWTYSAITISSTEGLGDIDVHSDGVRTAVGLQMMLGPISLAWVASMFFGQGLPPDVQAKLETTKPSSKPTAPQQRRRRAQDRSPTSPGRPAARRRKPQ